MANTFVFHKDVSPESVGEGVSRRVLAHSDTMMIVEVAFKTDAIGAEHTHPHEQVTYIVSGRFRFSNGEEMCEVGSGDTIRFAPDTPHGTACLEAGVLIDVFSPARQDFL